MSPIEQIEDKPQVVDTPPIPPRTKMPQEIQHSPGFKDSSGNFVRNSKYTAIRKRVWLRPDTHQMLQALTRELDRPMTIILQQMCWEWTERVKRQKHRNIGMGEKIANTPINFDEVDRLR